MRKKILLNSEHSNTVSESQATTGQLERAESGVQRSVKCVGCA